MFSLPDLDVRLTLLAKALIPAMFGIVCHEVAHGWTAYKLGDNTAKFLGRLTLNPTRHFDVSGVGFFVFTTLFTPFIFGWAKPVPVRPQFFNNPRQGMMLVSVAGPLANFMVAMICALLSKALMEMMLAGVGFSVGVMSVLIEAALIGVMVNISLAWFNLLPIPPLDGSHILEGLLPRPLAAAYASLGRYGMLILVLLLMTGIFSKVLMPLISGTRTIMFQLVGLNF